MALSSKGSESLSPEEIAALKTKADGDDADAQYGYGVFLRSAGRPDEAARYFQLGADQDHAKCLHMYGVCLEEGFGVPISLEDAADYYRRSMLEGYPEAQYAYAQCLRQGKGVLVDCAAALHYSKLSARQGHCGA
jgi:TPR repeat protein